MSRLFHIARRVDWERALGDGAYRVSTLGKSLEEVGFIHLSFAHQVKGVADAFYRGVGDLVLLELDPSRLGAPVVVEAVEEGGEGFPHLYGEIVTAAVVSARPYEPRDEGSFDAVEVPGTNRTGSYSADHARHAGSSPGGGGPPRTGRRNA